MKEKRYGRLYSVRSITMSPSSVCAVILSGTRSASSVSHTSNVRAALVALELEVAAFARNDVPEKWTVRAVAERGADRLVADERHVDPPQPAAADDVDLLIVPAAARQPRSCAIAECESWTVTLPKSTFYSAASGRRAGDT